MIIIITLCFVVNKKNQTNIISNCIDESTLYMSNLYMYLYVYV